MPANKYGVARHSSSKLSEKGGMRSHVTKIMEWDRLEDLKPYSHEAGQDGHQGIMTDQSALVTRYEYQTSPEIDLDWVLYSIVVQSPLLRRVLESMLGYHFGDIPSCDSIHTSSGRVEIRAPFQLSL